MSKQSSRRRSRPRTRTDRAPAAVRAMGPSDLLRFVPELVAVDPEDSLVLILFRRSHGTRSRTQGAMRIDLPHGFDDERLDRWAAAVLGQVLKVERITGIAAVAYTPDTFAPDGRPPAAAELRAVGRQAARMGLEVLDRFTVAPDGWGSLDDPELPRGGRPLAEIEPEERTPRLPRAAAEVPLAPLAIRRRFQEQYTAWWRFADGPGRTLHGVPLMRPGTALGLLPEGEPAMERYRWGRDVQEVLDLVEGMLEPHDDGGEAPCPCRALLLALAERQGIENLVLLQLAWGRAIGQEMWTAVNAPEGRRRSLDRLVAAIGGGRFRRPDPTASSAPSPPCSRRRRTSRSSTGPRSTACSPGCCGRRAAAALPPPTRSGRSSSTPAGTCRRSCSRRCSGTSCPSGRTAGTAGGRTPTQPSSRRCPPRPGERSTGARRS